MTASKRPSTPQMTAGRLGEDAAAAYYEHEGYTVVARNVRMSHNELDLIVENAESLVFVEVKARRQAYASPSRFGRPASAVDQSKRVRTAEAAAAYLRRHPTAKQPRIDVVEVYLHRSSDGVLTVERVVPFRNAFGAGGR